MARKLAYTIHVPVPGDEYRHEVFLRGEELPEWAAPLVGDHVFEPGDQEEPESHEDDGPDEPDESDEDGEDEPQPGQPAGNASADAWRLYAMSKGADPDDVLALSRNELRDKYGN